MLYIYLNFIKDDDMEIYKNWALPIMKTAYFFRAIYAWIASIIFFPIFIIGMIFEEEYKEEFDKQMKKMIEVYTKNNRNI